MLLVTVHDASLGAVSLPEAATRHRSFRFSSVRVRVILLVLVLVLVLGLCLFDFDVSLAFRHVQDFAHQLVVGKSLAADRPGLPCLLSFYSVAQSYQATNVVDKAEAEENKK